MDNDPYFSQPFQPLPIQDGGSYIIRWQGYSRDGAFQEGLEQVTSMPEVAKFLSTHNLTKMDVEFIPGA